MRPICITIDSLVHSKVMHWVRKADKYEVSGFGKVVQMAHGLHVTEAVLVKQENTSFSTDIDAATVGKAMFETKDQPGDLLWWWHSHGHGSTFFSGTDHAQIENFGKHGWIAATVFNIFGDNHSAFYARDPFPHYSEDIRFQPIHFASEALAQTWDADYLAKVRNFDVRYGKYGRKGKRQLYEASPIVSRWDDIGNTRGVSRGLSEGVAAMPGDASDGLYGDIVADNAFLCVTD